MSYVIITVFNIVIFIIGPTPYTMEECAASLYVLEESTELDAVNYCVEPGHVPPLEEITPEIQALIDNHVATHHK